MSTDLETILSGQAANAPAPEATTNTPKPETPAAPQAQAEPSTPDDTPADERGMVPVAALQAERQKAKRYTEQVAEFQKQLADQRDQFEQHFAQLFGAIQRPQAQAEPQAPPNYWDAPEDFTRREIQQGVEPLTQRQMALAREVAEVRFQPPVVEAAVAAFDQEVAARRLDPAVHAQIMNSPNPFAAAVQWHQRTTIMAEIGNDPAAFLARKEAEIREKVMAELQQGQHPAAQGAAPVMPSNFATGRNVGARTGPAWAGPTSLGDIFKR